MTIIRHLRFTFIGSLFLLFGLVGLISASVALALTPKDLIVVFNRNVPESREVAVYYAQKRGVPRENLVGVKVSKGEDMSRQEYEQELLPPLRRIVVELRLLNRKPAIVLVYGIPLRVGSAGLSESEKDLQALVQIQVKKSTSQAWARLQELEALLIRVPGTPQDTGEGPTPQDVVALAAKLLPRANSLLKLPSGKKTPQKTRTQIAALVAELSGRSPDLQPKSHKKKEKESGKYDVPLLEGHPAPEMNKVQPGAEPAEQAKQWAARIRNTEGLLGEVKFWQRLNQLYGRPRTGAAVDSELTLLLVKNYPRVHWMPNPLHRRYDKEPSMREFRQAVVMVGRLDGPTPEIARRLVNDALKTERDGLHGTCYLDARGLKGKERVGSYAWFDAHLEHLAELMKKRSTMKVVLDLRPGLFLRGSCPQAALYCGWYSLRKYVPSCTWQRGAVAYHVASGEATTLRKPGSQVWCKRMLEEGVAATLGPVAEPYLTAFPLPDDFFPLLMTGKLSLLEVYFRTIPHLSWQMILIGDPLYKPFKKDPAWRP
ncbi:MAG: TIGR03790 family protein [Syntrophobacterales bacterium]